MCEHVMIIAQNPTFIPKERAGEQTHNCEMDNWITVTFFVADNWSPIWENRKIRSVHRSSVPKQTSLFNRAKDFPLTSGNTWKNESRKRWLMLALATMYIENKCYLFDRHNIEWVNIFALFLSLMSFRALPLRFPDFSDDLLLKENCFWH